MKNRTEEGRKGGIREEETKKKDEAKGGDDEGEEEGEMDLRRQEYERGKRERKRGRMAGREGMGQKERRKREEGKED